MTHLVPLTFQNLDDMDRGRVGLLFRKVLQAVTADMMDRPTDASGKTVSRKILIELELEPTTTVDPDSHGVVVEAITGDVKIKSKVPVHRSAPVAFAVARGNELYFNPDVPGRDGLSQPPLPGTGHQSGDTDA